MAEMKEQIAQWVRQIDDLNRQLEDHWSKVQKAVAGDRIDDAIPLLNGYFSLKAKLEQIEASLKSLLHSYFSDK
jgi:hypothetical protein